MRPKENAVNNSRLGTAKTKKHEVHIAVPVCIQLVDANEYFRLFQLGMCVNVVLSAGECVIII